jgi:DNA-binding NarL/FixJ family response regulator
MSRIAPRPHCSRVLFVGASVEQIRVLIGDMPRMMRELVGAAVSGAPDITLVGSAHGGEPLAASLDRTTADVLIVGVPHNGISSTIDSLLYDHPRLTLLTIGEHGRSTELHELRPHSIALGEVSPTELVDAIRASARAKAGAR